MRYLIAALAAAPLLLADVAVRPAVNSTYHLPQLSIDTTKSEAETMPFDTARFDFDRGSTMLAVFAPAPVAPLTLAPASGWNDAAPDDGDPAALSTQEFCAALTTAASDAGIPVSFFARLIWQESQFKSDEVSHAGAQGVAQFMPDTAAEEGLDNPFDPRKALPASARLLRKLRDRLGNLGLAAAAYNAGPGRIQDWVARRAALPAETRNYVHRITGNAAENWLREAKTIGLVQHLPREAPCEGIGGLSRGRPPVEVAVALAPDVRDSLQQARREAARAARAQAAKQAHRRLEGRSKTRLAGKQAPRAMRIATASR
ncbi:lytic transglycosylase domain-containing protein [Bradyrhizobium sp. U87765 SZCCT0131]|uniref:lytic transglycosylase domain-containing protein n=1 Tax=unclassified Bradyrhizobium TaxID=2631580 RepID=UPI001BA8B049|nr:MULTISPECIES: lytic transglycosylase domain-containing protein [unclassified Bradyrhizobium]MBR1219100.1 lytic transglycosylase domain-containing protein [Bradyrhizobium sp. U87765 SZCCT0131]MBR1261751.1 lytic transglycosylase domain-containing protein [Bradyrhizobium sp. U87765 SZCCT0134]MBR1306396.1 lytic transglycosylase domain-containing protein [Bradyrhizobium sp. U87765 SZCCT0110]MBR1317533.1 lytic transglycosylase domain-containing protein [Bradyrhizobium sp. U87765 SZCCT0109]MBR1351